MPGLLSPELGRALQKRKALPQNQLAIAPTNDIMGAYAADVANKQVDAAQYDKGLLDADRQILMKEKQNKLAQLGYANSALSRAGNLEMKNRGLQRNIRADYLNRGANNLGTALAIGGAGLSAYQGWQDRSAANKRKALYDDMSQSIFNKGGSNVAQNIGMLDLFFSLK